MCTKKPGTKSNWMCYCLFAVGSSHAWHPGAQYLLRSSGDPFRARSNTTSSRKAFWSPQQGAFQLLQNPQPLFGPVLWHLAFSPLQKAFLPPCLIFPANLWALKDWDRGCSISVQSLDENTVVVSVPEGFSAIPSVLPPQEGTTLRMRLLESLFIKTQSFIFVPWG